MALSCEDLVHKLSAAGIQFIKHEHAAAMTVDDQVAALQQQGVTGSVIRNLFIKDKKNRYYIISAVPETKVDLNVLSARLGTGRGGLKFAAEEALQDVLQVPPGSVTPLVVANPGAKDVVLLMDARIQQCSAVVCHPLVNTSSLVFSPEALVQALKAVGREAIFVDLELDPKIDRDNPPDLAKYCVAPPPKQEASSSSSSAATTTQAPAPSKPAANTASTASTAKSGGSKAAKAPGGKDTKLATPAKVSEYEQHQALTDVADTTQDLLNLVCQALAGQSFSDKAASMDPYTVRRITADLESKLSAFKNASYALGYNAGKGEVVAFAQRKFA